MSKSPRKTIVKKVAEKRETKVVKEPKGASPSKSVALLPPLCTLNNALKDLSGKRFESHVKEQADQKKKDDSVFKLKARQVQELQEAVKKEMTIGYSDLAKVGASELN